MRLATASAGLALTANTRLCDAGTSSRVDANNENDLLRSYRADEVHTVIDFEPKRLEDYDGEPRCAQAAGRPYHVHQADGITLQSKSRSLTAAYAPLTCTASHLKAVTCILRSPIPLLIDIRPISPPSAITVRGEAPPSLSSLIVSTS